MKPAYLSSDDIEARAEHLLAEYERRARRPLPYPVPIERIVNRVLDLPVLWAPIPACNGREIVSKITQPTLDSPSHIVLNEDLLPTKFRDCPGLEQTALAHEAGHAVFHIEHGRRQQLGLGLTVAEDDVAFASEAHGLTDGFAEAVERGVIAARGPIGDDWWREWQAHTFMRFVLMPQRLLLPVIAEGGYQSWSGRNGLYDLRQRFGVTISTLTVHLEKLRIARVDKEGKIHDLAPLAAGQRSLSA